MQNDSFLIKIDLTPEYQRNLKHLAKKYRNIRSDTQSFITELQKGNLLGDTALPGVMRYTSSGQDARTTRVL